MIYPRYNMLFCELLYENFRISGLKLDLSFLVSAGFMASIDYNIWSILPWFNNNLAKGNANLMYTKY